MIQFSRSRLIFSSSIFLLVAAGMFLWAPTTRAATYHRASVMSVGAGSQKVKIFGGAFTGGSAIATGDVNGDGDDETIVASGPGGKPTIEIYSPAGRRLSVWSALNKETTVGLNVAAGDLTGDGKAEVVVASQPGYPTRVIIYASNGKVLRSFAPFAKTYTGGAHVAVVPAANGEPARLAVASGTERIQEVAVYDALGKTKIGRWLPYGKKLGAGVNVAAAWSEQWQEPVIISGAGFDRRPEVMVYGMQSKKVVARWRVYEPKPYSGVRVAANGAMIMTAPGSYQAADVRWFSHGGEKQKRYFAFEKTFRGGANIALGLVQGEVRPYAVPSKAPMTGAAQGKRIVVNLKTQTLQMLLNGQVISLRRVSSGKASMPTPTGEFQTRNKIPLAYSRPYNLYMENWMAFTKDGRYGMHSLPFWKLKGGKRLYEGAAHIGTPVSHGCIRQTLVESKSLYDWAPIGTPVTIRP